MVRSMSEGDVTIPWQSVSPDMQKRQRVSISPVIYDYGMPIIGPIRGGDFSPFAKTICSMTARVSGE